MDFYFILSYTFQNWYYQYFRFGIILKYILRDSHMKVHSSVKVTVEELLLQKAHSSATWANRESLSVLISSNTQLDAPDRIQSWSDVKIKIKIIKKNNKKTMKV